MVSQSVGQEAGTHGHDSVRYSFEFMPDQRRTFELKVRNKGFNATQKGFAYNTIDSATRSTANETNSKFGQSRRQERSSMVQSLMSKEKTPKKNRTIMSHMSPRPQIMKFSNQSFQIFTDLEQIHRKIDEGEIKLDVEAIMQKKPNSGGFTDIWSLAKQALEANLRVEKEAERSWLVYSEAMKNTIAALPMP